MSASSKLPNSQCPNALCSQAIENVTPYIIYLIGINLIRHSSPYLWWSLRGQPARMSALEHAVGCGGPAGVVI